MQDVGCRCTLNGVTFAYKYTTFANCASFLQHCHAVTVDCGLMDIRTDRLFLSGYKFPLAFPSTLCTTPT